MVQVSESPQGGAQVGDHAGLDAAVHDVPGVGALDLVADPHAPRAEHAAVVIDDETLVRGIDRMPRLEVGHVDVGHADLPRQVLQFAVAVRDADRADVIALREQQLDDRPAVALQGARYWSGPPCPRRPSSRRPPGGATAP